MNFVWSSSDIATETITISESSITLNKAACHYFEDVNYVLLGIDYQAHQIGIKPIHDQEIQQNLYPKSQLHHISIGKSYARITSKTFIQDLIQTFHLDLTTNLKLEGHFDVIHQIFIISIKEE